MSGIFEVEDAVPFHVDYLPLLDFLPLVQVAAEPRLDFIASFTFILHFFDDDGQFADDGDDFVDLVKDVEHVLFIVEILPELRNNSWRVFVVGNQIQNYNETLLVL